MKIRTLARIQLGDSLYAKGDTIRDEDVTEHVKELAGGKKIVGQRVLEFVGDSVAPDAPEVPVEPEPEPSPEPLTLRDHLFAGIREGQSKSAMLRAVAKAAGVTQKAAGEELDAVIASGLIADTDGVYTVTQNTQGAE